MKDNKLVIILLSVLIAVLAASAISLGFIWTKKDSTEDKKTSYVMEYLQEEYNVGDSMVYRLTVYSDITFVSLSYKVGQSEEQTIVGVKTGKSSELSSAPKDAGAYYADTKVQVVDTSEFDEGYYAVVFYGYDEDNTRYQINSEPYMFRLVEAETA